jgi:hypothetical protein
MRGLSPVAASFLCLSLLAPLLGCDDQTDDADAGVDAGVDLEAYTGLRKGRCLEYTSAAMAQPAPDLGIVVEELDETQFNTPTRKVVYRASGTLAMRDFVSFDGNVLKLHKREFPGGKSYLYSPPLALLEAPLAPGSKFESTGEASIRSGSGTVLADHESHTLRVDVFQPADLLLPMGPTVSASKLLYSETPSVNRVEVRSFVPGSGALEAAEGFVTMEYNFSLDEAQPKIAYKLQKIRDLGNDPGQANPPCGMQ